MRLDYTVTLDDVLAFNVHFNRNSDLARQIRRRSLYFGIGFCALLPVVVYLFVRNVRAAVIASSVSGS
jgi:hypothetical protein